MMQSPLKENPSFIFSPFSCYLNSAISQPSEYAIFSNVLFFG